MSSGPFGSWAGDVTPDGRQFVVKRPTEGAASEAAANPETRVTLILVRGAAAAGAAVAV